MGPGQVLRRGRGDSRHINAARPPEAQSQGRTLPLVMHGVGLAKTSAPGPRLRGLSPEDSAPSACHGHAKVKHTKVKGWLSGAELRSGRAR